ncbi:hypothetical protein SH501x_005113 [Pirellulaceae bacterium SH501]
MAATTEHYNRNQDRAGTETTGAGVRLPMKRTPAPDIPFPWMTPTKEIYSEASLWWSSIDTSKNWPKRRRSQS